MDRETEAELVLRCRQGDTLALRELYDAHASPLLRYLERVLTDSGAAEDVCQEAFLRLWRRAELFDPERGRFGAWLYRTASNLAFNRMSLKSSRETPMDPALDVRVEPRAGPLEEATVVERRRLLHAALERLGPQDRAILSLRHLEERPVAEVAEILSIPQGTVKSRVHYAVRRLKQLLEQTWGQSEGAVG